MKTLITPGPVTLTVVELPTPEPAAGQVLVRVHAATVNPVDAMSLAGAFRELGLVEQDRPVGLGWDLVGTVDRVGPGVSGWEIGDEVAALVASFANDIGAISEYVAVPVDDLARLPQGLALLEAAGIGMNAVTAAQALTLAGPAEGRTLLITGAAGSVGGFAVELATDLGFTVTGLARETDQQFVERTGARLVTDLADEATYDVVFDAAPLQLDATAFAALDPRVGAHFIGVLAAFPAPELPGRKVESVSVASDGPTLDRLLKAALAGTLTSRVAGTTPLNRAEEAFAQLAKPGQRGRWLVTPALNAPTEVR